MLTQRSRNAGGSVVMPSTKIEAFLVQFPWVRNHVGDETISQVYVSAVEPNFLIYCPLVQDLGGMFFPDDIQTETLLLLDDKGDIVTTEVTEPVKHRKPWPFGKRTVVNESRLVTGRVSETMVQRTLDSLGETTRKNIRFALSYDATTQAVIVYKIPKSLSIDAWLAQQLEAEKKALRETCENIDSQAKVS